jgi:hypothetical protein
MFNKLIVAGVFVVGSAVSMAQAETVPIQGTVQSKCIIQTSTAGTYGNPNAYTLSTQAADGGDQAVVRIDVTLADAYFAEITPPTEFSSSPSLPDVVTWTGDVSVQAVSDASGMGTYETDKLEIGDTDRYTLTATGSTWFAIHSKAEMGGNKAFPGGNYTALAEAVCIAK